MTPVGGELRTRAFATRPAVTNRPRTLSQFIDRHYRHFNAARLREAAEAYLEHLYHGGQMFVAMAGAMSTAELGRSLAEMIRQDRVHGICCTGANLEEDVFLYVAHDQYKPLPDYHDLTPEEEHKLFVDHINRVTDTGIPEKQAMSVIEAPVIERWKAADASGESRFPHEYLIDVLQEVEPAKDMDPADSWLLAAAEKKIPIVVPGWEDSTLGNVFAALCLKGDIKKRTTVKSGIDYMVMLAEWYRKTAPRHALGFFQIGGGIAGDFPICVVPLLQQDAKQKETPFWTYFCQVTDADESFGGYSGALPNEKITWGKIEPKTPSFVVKSDATIVCPLIFGYVLGW